MTDRGSSLQRLYDIVDLVVDEHVGIVRYASEMPKEAGAPDFFHFYAKACNTQAFSKYKNFADAGGAAADRGAAMAKAIGEAIERYCAAIYDPEELPLSSFDSAPFQCVSPDAFALFSESQYAQPDFSYRPFHQGSLVRWTPALHLASKEIWYVPAAMVFIPYSCDEERGEVSVVQPISTGMACHCSMAEASISAICEVIERDAFTIVWQAKLGMPHVKIESLSPDNQDLVDRFVRTGSQVTVLNITLDHGVPTILSVLRSEALDSPALLFAASSHIDPEQAVRKSLEELAHTRRNAQHIKSSWPDLVAGDNFENISKQDRHMRLYSDHENIQLAEFILSSERRIDFESIPSLASADPEHGLQSLVTKLCAIDHQVLIADLTTPDVGALGLRVVRAIIPGFHPLFMGHRFRALGGRRLWEVPQQLGYVGICHKSGDNPAPHPYP